MTIAVTIDIDTPSGAAKEIVGVSTEAEEAIRFSFNPSGLQRVTRLKALAAAFISECDAVLLDGTMSGREMAVAKTQMQTASMWAVLGATKGAP
jgi:hypothetical protein